MRDDTLIKRSIITAVITAGASSMISQIVFLREFLVVFYGNEISVGIILASWLIWGAFGSGILGRISDRTRGKEPLFGAAQLLLSAVLPASLVLIRGSRGVMGLAPGEIAGYPSIMLSSFFILSLPCAITGFMFSLACSLYGEHDSSASRSIGKVYMLEASGSLAGGMIASFVLIRTMRPASITLLLAFLNACAASFFLFSRRRRGIHPALIRAAAAFSAAAFLALLFGAAPLRKFSLSRLWSGFEVLSSRDSIYGNLTVTRRPGQVSFYENGLHLYTVPDLYSAEESVHYAMAQPGKTAKVLLVGGGAGGLIDEVLKYDVHKVDYVELDPLIIEEAERRLPPEYLGWLEDPRVNIVNMDGRFFIKHTREKYDRILVNLGDPYTAQINRFYTLEFFREAGEKLADEGIISFGLTSSANYLSRELRDYLASIYRTARAVFRSAVVLPGNTAYFLLSDTARNLTADPLLISQRVAETAPDARYVRDYLIMDKLSPHRVEEIRKALISTAADVPLNTDFRPISYFFATVFWSSQFDLPALRSIRKLLEPENIRLFVALLCAALIFGYLLNRRAGAGSAAILAVMTTGFAEITFQISILLSFQAIYGFMFYKLGIINTTFMAGLAAGGYAAYRRVPQIKDDMRIFMFTQAAICVYPLILPFTFAWLARTGSPSVSWFGSNVIFSLLPFLAGAAGGIQFPLAGRIALRDGRGTGRTAGLTYSMDLAGACIGSVLAASVLIPVLGIYQTCYLTALINLTVLCVLVIAGKRKAVKP